MTDGRAPAGPGSREPSPSVSAASGFDPSRFAIPVPREGESIHLNLIQRPKSVGLWWSLRDQDGWVDGGCVSSHRTRSAAQTKSREVAAWLCQRDSDRNPQGGDGTAPSQSDESAGPQDIAQSTPTSED